MNTTIATKTTTLWADDGEQYPIWHNGRDFESCCTRRGTCAHGTATARERLHVATLHKSTERLLTAHANLRGIPETEMTPSLHTAMAVVAQVIEERHNLTETLDAIYSQPFDGTYHDALLAALDKVNS